MSLFPFFSSFPYMFRSFMGPSSGVFQAVVFMLPFGSCVGQGNKDIVQKAHLLVILIVTRLTVTLTTKNPTRTLLLMKERLSWYCEVSVFRLST